MTQERVDRFADVTEDHNFIHVDPERAAQTQFGGTIAHGYLTVSLLAPISQQLLAGHGCLDRDQLRGGQGPLPRTPAGRCASFAGAPQLSDVEEVGGGLQVKLTITVEVKGAVKPALVAECLFRYFA